MLTFVPFWFLCKVSIWMGDPYPVFGLHHHSSNNRSGAGVGIHCYCDNDTWILCVCNHFCVGPFWMSSTIELRYQQNGWQRINCLDANRDSEKNGSIHWVPFRSSQVKSSSCDWNLQNLVTESSFSFVQIYDSLIRYHRRLDIHLFNVHNWYIRKLKSAI